MNPLASYKCALRLLMAVVAAASIVLAVGCGSSGGFTRPNQNGFTAANLSGTYVISVSGTDVIGNTFSFFAITGTVTTDGKGMITGGSVDINDPDLGGVFPGQTLGTSTYTVSPDGRGTATLNTPQGNFGLDFVLTSSSHGLIMRFDGNGSGSGTLDLQGSATQASLASLVVSLSGSDLNGNPLGSVGAFTLDNTGTITTGLQDFNDAGSSSVSGLNGSALTGSLVLSSTTAGTAQLNSGLGNLTFDVWVIDSTHLKLIETDASGLVLVGDAFTQQTSFTAGQLVYTMGGFDSGFVPEVAGGFITAAANGALSNGIEDLNDGGNLPNRLSNISGNCTTFTGGRCQLALTGFSNNVTGTPGSFVFAAYPSTGGVQLLEIDNLGILQGAAYPQTATSFAASEGYGLNLTGSNGNGEVDDIAQFNATTTNVAGVLDENDVANVLLSNLSMNGTYVPDTPATGGSGSITVNNINTLTGTLNLEYYVVNASTVLAIELDFGQATFGSFQLQATPTGPVGQSRISIAHPVFATHGALHKNGAFHKK